MSQITRIKNAASEYAWAVMLIRDKVLPTAKTKINGWQSGWWMLLETFEWENQDLWVTVTVVKSSTNRQVASMRWTPAELLELGIQ